MEEGDKLVHVARGKWGAQILEALRASEPLRCPIGVGGGPVECPGSQ